MTEDQLQALADRLTFHPFHYEWVYFSSPDYEKFAEEARRITSGTIIRTKRGDIELVGDINKNRGRCDCCVDTRLEDITEIAHINELLFPGGAEEEETTTQDRDYDAYDMDEEMEFRWDFRGLSDSDTTVKGSRRSILEAISRCYPGEIESRRTVSRTTGEMIYAVSVNGAHAGYSTQPLVLRKGASNGK